MGYFWGVGVEGGDCISRPILKVGPICETFGRTEASYGALSSSNYLWKKKKKNCVAKYIKVKSNWHIGYITKQK